MLIETAKSLTIRRISGDLCLTPGCLVELPDEEARKLLAKAHGKVRAFIIIELATKPDGSPLSPVYWERRGRIVGPGQPEMFFQDSAGQVGLILRYQGELVSVADSMLRSRQAFEGQSTVRIHSPGPFSLAGKVRE